MPQGLEKLKRAVAEKKKSAEPGAKSGAAVPDQIDMEKVEKIVEKMKKKYAAEGVEFERVGGRLAELRGIIAEETGTKLRVQTVEDLREFRSPFVKSLGGFYLRLRMPMSLVMKLVNAFPGAKNLAYNLYSANMRYSAQQYLALVASVAIIVFFVALVAAGGVMVFVPMLPIAVKAVLPFIIAPFVMLFAIVIALIVPKSRADARGNAISAELPFALRHMGTELKSGIGLYKTLQTIAVADYGVLSEEFARAITEVEEGTDTKDALRNLALRTQSRPLKMALMHVIRTLKTGGNLSEIISDIADDVSFELRMKIRDFSEKINFFGVIFIVMGIVFPVMIAILGAIANAPLPLPLEFPPRLVAVFFVAAMPMLLAILIMYLRMIQPRI